MSGRTFRPWQVRRKVQVGDLVASAKLARVGTVVSIRNEGKPQRLVYDVYGTPSGSLWGFPVRMVLTRDQFTRVYYADSDDGSLVCVEPTKKDEQ